MPYDFSRFSPQSFERLIQALAAATIGGRIQVYGAGKDGAREATYTGRCRIADTEWDGYVVFQAKHHGIQAEAASNAEWLIRQIDLEMAKFENPKRKLKRPEYYVLASNVRLSAAAANARGRGQGGIDKVIDHLSKWASRLGFRGFHVWHADLLASLLDAHPGVRTTFDFWVQPGDVLAGLLRQLSGPNKTETLTKYLQDCLRQSREIKTRDIGQAVGRTVTLDEVFVDLPVSLHTVRTTWGLASGDPPFAAHEGEDEVGEHEADFIFDDVFSTPKVLAQLLQQADDVFSPHGWSDADGLDPRGLRIRRREPLPNRVVLLGGPGQGKSTIGQFLAQYLRASLLRQIQALNSPETNVAIDAVLKSAENQAIPRTGPLRYPFHVELPRYADLLSEATRGGQHLSIVDYLAREISKGTVPGPTATNVIHWLKTIPSTIILDGLDEVPHSGNRSEVINAIEELLDVLHGANADAFIFSTSRPQGYQQELSPRFWSHWELNALGTEDALDLARKVAPVLVGEPTRQGEVLAILADAAQEEATASLLTTPLQVMLLFHLVSTHNNIPKDRWTLFHRHYEILRDREIAKGGEAGTTIRTHRTQIDRIHYDAGYLLHLRAEISGRADAYFTDDEFRALVRTHLQRDGFDDQLEELAEEIAKLATNRLVFLRSAVEGRVAFDVRSLQEFMAAARMTASPEAKIRDRLYEIAGRAHWHHVFKIACSKIYASTGHEGLHDAVVGLLDALDAGDRASDDRLLRTGSRLALDLLVDGTMNSVPNYRRKLLSRAVSLVHTPESLSISRLKYVIDVGQRTLLEPLFVEALSVTPDVRRCMLRLLALLSSGQDKSGWVTDLLLSWWPAEKSDVLGIFDEAYVLPLGGRLAERLRADQWQVSPRRVASWVDGFNQGDPDEPNVPANLLICNGHPLVSTFRLRTPAGALTPITFTYCSMSNAMWVDEPPEEAALEWKIAKAAAVFSEGPSVATAAAFLKTVRDQNCIGVYLGIALPWPLEALLRSIKDETTCDTRIVEVLAGHHGDQETWKRSEENWTVNGVGEDDIRTSHDFTIAPLDIVGQKGPPILGQRFTSVDDDGNDPKQDIERDLVELVRRQPNCVWARSGLFLYASRRKGSPPSPELTCFLLSPDPPDITPKSAMRRYHARALLQAMPHVTDNRQLAERLLQVMQKGPLMLSESPSVLETLIKLLSKNPTFRVLIPSIAQMYLGEPPGKSALPEAAFMHAPDDTPDIAASVSQLRVATEYELLDNEVDLKILLSSTAAVSSLLWAGRRHWFNEKARNWLLMLCREVLIKRLGYVTHAACRWLQNMDEARPVMLREDDCARALSLPTALPGP